MGASFDGRINFLVLFNVINIIFCNSLVVNNLNVPFINEICKSNLFFFLTADTIESAKVKSQGNQ